MIKVKKIEGIGLACNCFIITDVKTGLSAIIDAGLSKETFEREAEKFDIKYVLLTHGHYDHISCLDYIVCKTGATAYIHKFDANLLTDTYLNLSEPFGFPPVIENTIPNLLEDNDKIILGETEIAIMHTPGHTEGSVMFIVKDAAFCGDTVFEGSIGRTDFPTSDVSKMKKSLLSISDLQSDYKLYCGHGNDTNLFFEKEHNIYLRGLN